MFAQVEEGLRRRVRAQLRKRVWWGAIVEPAIPLVVLVNSHESRVFEQHLQPAFEAPKDVSQLGERTLGRNALDTSVSFRRNVRGIPSEVDASAFKGVFDGTSPSLARTRHSVARKSSTPSGTLVDSCKRTMPQVRSSTAAAVSAIRVGRGSSMGAGGGGGGGGAGQKSILQSTRIRRRRRAAGGRDMCRVPLIDVLSRARVHQQRRLKFLLRSTIVLVFLRPQRAGELTSKDLVYHRCTGEKC